MSATALARLACKGILVMFRQVISGFCVWWFPLSSVLRGSRIPPLAYCVRRPPPKTMVFSKDSGGFWQVEGSPPLVGASGAPEINIFWSRSTKNQYFLSPEHQKSIFSIPEHQKSIFLVPRAPKINIFCPQSTKNQCFLSPEHHNSRFFTPHSINK